MGQPEQPDWAPTGVDISVPSHARVYDYLLGGAHNFGVDRELARQLVAVMPDLPQIMRANRAFLHRAVRFMVDEGVRQFLDIGSGIPTVGNVHEIAQRAAPEARVVYVDIDPVAVTHSRQLLADNDRARAIQEDMRRADGIVNHPDTRALLDFDQPVGLILAAILQAVPDQTDLYGQVARLRDALCPGSYLTISHPTADSRPEEVHAAERVIAQTPMRSFVRTRAEVMRFFGGFDLVEPGLVWISEWRPESPDEVGDHPERLSTYAGVGRKP